MPPQSSDAAGKAASKTVKRPRGRPPLPVDNETRERLLNAAQQLFAERSFTQVSVREITDKAGVALSAINYHFGGKDDLIYALARRTGPELIRERAQLLQAAEAQGGDVEQRVRGVLHALVAPVIRWYRRPQTRKYFIPFQRRAMLDGPPRVRKLFAEDIRHLEPFVQALSRLLPELSPEEIGWRLHFVLGIEHTVINEADRLAGLTNGLSDSTDDDVVIERVIDFACRGLLPGIRETAAAPPRADN